MIRRMPDTVPPHSSTVYEHIVALEQARTPFVVVTLIEALGSVPQDTGAKMLVTQAGRFMGTIGGGRVEAQALALAREIIEGQGHSRAQARLVNWSLKGDVGMTCGGSVKLYFEPHLAGSEWTVAVFGAGYIAQALIPVLIPLPCRMLCFDSRAEWLGQLPAARNLVAEQRTDLAAAIDLLPDDAFVLCMTQGHHTDRPILERALRTRAFPYVGVIGSAAKAAVLRRDLIAAGLDAESVARFHCPIGLEFGTNHPHEIALSIAAQLLTERDRKRGSAKAVAVNKSEVAG
jgi:xanthine dehydrogenase accessory factor